MRAVGDQVGLMRGTRLNGTAPAPSQRVLKETTKSPQHRFQVVNPDLVLGACAWCMCRLHMLVERCYAVAS